MAKKKTKVVLCLPEAPAKPFLLKVECEDEPFNMIGIHEVAVSLPALQEAYQLECRDAVKQTRRDGKTRWVRVVQILQEQRVEKGGG